MRRLLGDTPGVLSLVAVAGPALTGHAVFTPCSVKDDAVALLGPLAVAPAWQKRGVGTALVQEGLERQRSAGVARVLVLGDPAYYGRFGFAAERSVAPPFAIPEAWRAAWQSIALREDARGLRGRLAVPPAWNKRALWAP